MMTAKQKRRDDVLSTHTQRLNNTFPSQGGAEFRAMHPIKSCVRLFKPVLL